MVKSAFIFSLFLFSIMSFAQESYTVRKGDTLLSIADKALGLTKKNDPRRYQFAKQIQALNPQLKNPNILEPGESITLPASAKIDTATAATAVTTPVVQPPTVVEEAAKPEETPVAETVPATNPVADEPTPAAHTAAHSADKHSQHPDFIFLQARYQSLKFKAKDETTKTESTLPAGSSYGLDLQYGKILNETWHLLFQAGFTQTNFKDFKETGRTINHKSETLKFFGLGVAYDLTHTLHLDLMATYADRTFLIPTTSTDYELKAHMIPGADLNISWDFYSGNSNIFGASAIGEYIASLKKDDIKYESAVEPVYALYWKSKNGHDSLNFKATLTYKHGHQKTNVSEQYEDLTTLGLGVYF